MNHPIKLFIFIYVTSLLFFNSLGLSSALGQTLPAQVHKNQPIHYYGYHATESGTKGKEVYMLWGVDPVTHRRPEIFLEKDQTTINADTVWYYSADSVFKGVGHVKIVKIDKIKGNMVATSRKATFIQDKNQITLEGNAKITQGDSEIEGDPIVITQNDEGTVLECTNASGVLVPQEKTDSKKN